MVGCDYEAILAAYSATSSCRELGMRVYVASRDVGHPSPLPPVKLGAAA